ncbi:MAG TPA: cytochrome B [Cyclobacteriaceae bacterium]|jgi:hypothetical protein|nr:cytochrome B [Cyclobacteriaceae bacterium]
MQILVALHSLNRFVLLILLLVVIVKSLIGWLNKSPFEKADDKLSLFLFISTHTQLLLGLILYFVSPVVIFSGASMSDKVARYWLVEHGTAMLIAIVLISMARIQSKKLAASSAKFKKLFTFNIAALVIILANIAMSHRGFFSVNW